MPPKKKPKVIKISPKTAKKTPIKRKALTKSTASPSQPKQSKLQKVKPQKKAKDADEENIKTITFTGTIPIDENCKQCQKGYHVLKESATTYYNATLNQTNIGHNNNKYYVMQVLEPDNMDGNGYCVWFRWGRVGKIGGTTFVDKLTQHKAKEMMIKKFYEKTKNVWHFRVCFIKSKGQYDLLEMDYGEEEQKNIKIKPTPGQKAAIASNLHGDIQDLMKMLFNVAEFEASVKEMKFDVKKAPLGKLTTKQIKSGYEALKKIEDCITKKKSRDDLMEACSEFYTKIPHDFGMKVPPAITTESELKEKISLLETLGDIQIAMEIMDKNDDGMNALDANYKSLEVELEPVDKKHADFKMIEKFITNTHGQTHSQYRLQTEKVFRVHKDSVKKKFKSNIGNRMLLWHGSRLTNWCGILRQGLRIAPPEAPVTGYMFGKGVYFADMVSKSANYCFASTRQPIGMLLLSEVALGNMNEKKYYDYDANKLPKGKHSTKGVGKNSPNKKAAIKMPCGTTVPLGKYASTGVKDTSLVYNEYIVYDVAQINPRYLIQTKFLFD